MITFLHTADWHLGHDQYNLAMRGFDNANAARWVCQEAVKRELPLLISGDIFHGRDPSPLAFYQAMRCLEHVKAGGFPAIAIAGNHDRGWRTVTSWLTVLRDMDLLTLLDVEISVGKVYWSKAVWEQDGLRVVGIPYVGAALPKLLPLLAEHLATRDRMPTVLMLHTDIEGVVPGFAATLAWTDLECVKPYVDYVAAGHLHKPFNGGGDERAPLVVFPGTMEAQSAAEADWYGGPVVVHLPANDDAALCEFLNYHKRRPYERLTLDVTGLGSMEAILNAVPVPPAASPEPLLDLTLTGALAIPTTALDLNAIRDKLEDGGALYALVRDKSTREETGVGLAAEGGLRLDLEHMLLTQSLSQDARFKDAGSWAHTALELRTLVEAGTQDEQAIRLVRAQREGVG